jgi:phosphoenolpyruvate carboxykinase (GTP)
MAMIPFIGYNIKDYFTNWLSMRKIAEETATDGASVVMPKIFHVNWFGKGDEGEFLWPGFAENCRVLDWVIERCAGRVDAAETAIGFVPSPGSLNLDGLEGFNEADLEKLLAVDPAKWEAEAAEIRKYFTETLMKGDSTEMPAALMAQLEQLEVRIAKLKAVSA